MKRQFIQVDTSKNAKKLDVTSSDGLLAFAIVVHAFIIVLIVLFFL